MKREMVDRRIMHQTRASYHFYLPDKCVKSTNIDRLLHFICERLLKKIVRFIHSSSFYHC